MTFNNCNICVTFMHSLNSLQQTQIRLLHCTYLYMKTQKQIHFLKIYQKLNDALVFFSNRINRWYGRPMV